MHDASPLRLDGPILQALLDLLPGTLHVKDRNLRYCIVNRRYLERWGGRAEDVIGRTSEVALKCSISLPSSLPIREAKAGKK